MQFVSASTINVVGAIPPALAHQRDPLKFHLEVDNLEAGTHTVFNNPVVVPAVGPSGSGPGTPGSVTFSGVTVPNAGLHVMRVMYASQVDLDGSPVSLSLMKRDTFIKVVPVTTVTL